MTAHLLLVTLGPVQEFIAQARRTRDLWFGSYLLSELARVAARSLAEAGARLIFPALEKGDPELEPSIEPDRANGQSPLNIANKLLAEVPAGTNPKELARKAREQMNKFWRDEVARKVRDRCTGLIAENTDQIWNEQLDTFLEFYAAWAPLVEYKATRTSLEQTLAGRKLLRNFSQWHSQPAGVPKSSFDGGRVSVLRSPKQRAKDLVQRYRLSEGEQLDAIGLIKRAGGNPEQFVPLVNVALARWVEFCATKEPEQLERVKQACRDIGIRKIDRKLPCTTAFPFDAEVFLRGRWQSIFEQLDREENATSWGEAHITPLLKRLSDPYPYVACLVADGDNMGKAISELQSPDAHRQFSSALGRFAREAREIVEQQYFGSLVYAGGDDVLAFLPLPDVLDCAHALHDSFSRCISEALPRVIDASTPTLSVGIGIGHIMESMGDLLNLGRKAERLAKQGTLGQDRRNALGVIVDKRSGTERSWRARWDDPDGDPAKRLAQDGRILDTHLSGRKVYEIASTLQRMPKPGAVKDSNWCDVLKAEVERSLSRVESGEEAITARDAGLRFGEDFDYVTLHREVDAWVNRMLIARTLAQATPKLRHQLEVTAT